MVVKGHIAVSIIISSLIYFLFRSIAMAFASLLAGTLIDLDHIIDYIYTHGYKTISYRNLIEASRNYTYKKLFLFLHSYELLLLILLIYLLSRKIIWLGIFIGLAQHLLLDQFFNPVRKLFYFLSFRIKEKFDASNFFISDEEKVKSSNA